MLTRKVDLTGLTIIDIGERARLPLSGEFDDRSLADLLVQEWIPYFECHKCGRFDFSAALAGPSAAQPAGSGLRARWPGPVAVDPVHLAR
jgi:hypothetical protein